MPFVNHFQSLVEEIQRVLAESLGKAVLVVPADHPPGIEDSLHLMTGFQDMVLIIPSNTENTEDDPTGNLSRIYVFNLFGYSKTEHDDRFTISELTEKSTYHLSKLQINRPHWYELQYDFNFIDPEVTEEDQEFTGVTRSRINLRISRNVCQ
jgi:hypothetical protein